jgi:2-C-methyl-D-erythritol 4-phosphate cytidylyltransferase
MTPCHALIPAGGSGQRMGSDRPKQYLPLGVGTTVLQRTVAALTGVARIESVWIVVAPDDPYIDSLDFGPDQSRVHVERVGGATRAHSVRHGLAAMVAQGCPPDAWVLVHDAARPCVLPQDIERLIDTLMDDPVGGILAQPVSETMKRADSLGRIAATIPRESLWRAQTPQMFRLHTLRQALAQQPDVTDEAQAIEALGLAPKLVASSADNLKITYASDIALASHILAARGA